MAFVFNGFSWFTLQADVPRNIQIKHEFIIELENLKKECVILMLTMTYRPVIPALLRNRVLKFKEHSFGPDVYGRERLLRIKYLQ